MASAPSFGQLLREHRRAVGLMQDLLAERAGLSVHGVQKLERGVFAEYARDREGGRRSGAEALAVARESGDPRRTPGRLPRWGFT
jgi:hypothetical protein